MDVLQIFPRGLKLPPQDFQMERNSANLVSWTQRSIPAKITRVKKPWGITKWKFDVSFMFSLATSRILLIGRIEPRKASCYPLEQVAQDAAVVEGTRQQVWRLGGVCECARSEGVDEQGAWLRTTRT